MSKTRKYVCHFGLLQRFLTKIIGCKNWVLKLLEEVKIPSESQPKPKTNYQVRKDPYVGKSPQRKSRNVLCLITMMSQTQQVL